MLLEHTSFRTVGSMERSPVGLNEALSLGTGTQGMLMTPSRIADDNRIFDPLTTPETPGLGVVPNLRGHVVS